MRKLARKILSPAYKFYEKRLERQVKKGQVPNHLAVIMERILDRYNKIVTITNNLIDSLSGKEE